MPKELKAKNAKTKVEIIYRFTGKDIFIKTASLQYAAQIIAQIQQKGGSVITRRGWTKRKQDSRVAG